MINRKNWMLVKSYLAYRAEVEQIQESTLGTNGSLLRHLLEWADEKPFSDVQSIRPTLPDYLKTVQSSHSENAISLASAKKIVARSRAFGEWLIKYQSGYKSRIPYWVDSLRLPRGSIVTKKEPEAVTLEEIYQIANAPAKWAWERRIKASSIFWFLSGIRIGAFVTLPLSAIDLDSRIIKQWPALGIKTKNNKHATTCLLNMPDLIEIVKDWESEVRAVLSDDAYFFAPLSRVTREIDPYNNALVGKKRDQSARKDLKRWMKLVDLPHHDPHKFRHGNAIYSLKRAQDMADFKAISMNLMHSSISVTDEIYSTLSFQDVSSRISTLGNNHLSKNIVTAATLRKIADQLENGTN